MGRERGEIPVSCQVRVKIVLGGDRHEILMKFISVWNQMVAGKDDGNGGEGGGLVLRSVLDGNRTLATKA